ncbi:S8 family serine peptidase [Nevskia sp.]|uniref:S8 family serine peptidase n=1 Tax=Nevskia sp. TaxID=1929292 RepID=UPI003F7213D4
MGKDRHQIGQRLRRAATECGLGLTRRAAPLALGLLASLSLVGNAGLPATRTAVAPAAQRAPVGQIKPSAAAQIAVLRGIKASATPVQRKLDSRLLMSLLQARGDARLAALSPQYRQARPGADGRHLVDISLRRGADPRQVLQALAGADAVLLSPKALAGSARSIRARVATRHLESLAALKAVSRIRQAAPAYTSRRAWTPGPVQVTTDDARPSFASRLVAALAAAPNRSEGVQTHGVDQARSLYGASGQGQVLCALSDGVDSLAAAQASGDLPPLVSVLPSQAGAGDEGTAMLEILHDLAPAARLGFATAFNGEASFAQNILDLASAGCTIIVDDVIYLDESPWQDGPVAQAVNTVTAAGVLYFSSAGNEGNRSDGTSGTWEGDFRASSLPNPPVLDGVGTLHDFGDGGQSLRVEAGDSGTPVAMIWAEHYTLDQGLASTDYDVYVLSEDLSTVVDSSANTQDGVDGDDFPFEFIEAGVNPGERVVVSLFSSPSATPPPFNLIVFRGIVDRALATSGATRGHSAAVAAFSTAATPAAVSFDDLTPNGPFPGLFGPGSATESFSADGPRKILLSPTGAELTPGDRSFATGGVVRRKPDLTAADGVSTSAPGFSTFYGTSAAAPHAAAIAALLKGARPSLSATAVRDTLAATAIDIEAPGPDRDSGVGIVMPVPALAAIGATPQPYLTAEDAQFTQIAGDGDGVIEPGESFALQLPLSNIGAVAATGIRATLTAAGSGVTVFNGSSDYADIAAGSTAGNDTALTFRVESSFPCGRNLSLVLSVAYNGSGSPQRFLLSEPTGSAGTPVTFRYGGPVLPIPDAGDPVEAALTIPGSNGRIRNLSVSIDGDLCSNAVGATTVGIDHSFVGDLAVSLVSPGGVVVPLINGAGSSGNNFCQVLLDDQSSGGSIQNISSANAPFTGSYTPASPLETLTGSVGNGRWALRVQDLAAADTGSVRAWSLRVTPAVCNAGAPVTGPIVTAIGRVNPSPTSNSSVDFQVRFSEAVSGVDAGDFRLTTTGALSGASVASVSGSGSLYSVRVLTGSGSGSLRLDVADDDSITSVASGVPLGGSGAGNGAFTVGEVYAVDLEPPTATIAVDGAQPDPVVSAPVLFVVTLSEATGDFAADDLELGGSARPTTARVIDSGPSYTVAVSGMSGNGTVTARVRAGAFTDAAGNASRASAVASANFSGVTPDVGFTLASQRIVEGDPSGATTTTPVTVTVSLSTPAGSDVTVPVNVDPASTATAGDDYQLSAAQLLIPAGQSVASLTMSVLRDRVQEPDETLVLVLGTPTGNARIGSPSTQVITIVNDDLTTPAPFSFPDTVDAVPGSVQTSAPATISGINQPATVTVSSGSYSISGGVFTSAPGTISNGQTLVLQQTASSAASTATTMTVTVGGVSASYRVVTGAAPAASGGGGSAGGVLLAAFGLAALWRRRRLRAS